MGGRKAGAALVCGALRAFGHVRTLVLAAMLTGCAPEGVERVEWTTMDTVAAVQCKGAGDVTRAAATVKDAFARVERLLNAFEPTSELNRLAKLPDDEVLATCDPLVRPCYAAAFRLRDETGGVFNPRWRGPGTLDLGAIAKGFAVDLAAERLRASAVTNCTWLVDLGGNLRSVGGVWSVGIAAPGTDVAAGRLTLADGQACATSGEYYRGHHIRDGRTGGEPPNAVYSVTVVHPDSAMLADGLSTVLFLLGRAEGERFLRERYPAARAIWLE